MNENENRKIINLESARKKQKAKIKDSFKQNPFERFFQDKKKLNGASAGKGQSYSPKTLAFWRWVQFFILLGLTAYLLQKCGGM